MVRRLLRFTALLKSKKVWLVLPFVIVSFVITAAFFGTWVTAQLSGQSLEVSPPSQEISIDPGQTITVKAKLINKTSDSLPIAVHIEDFSATGDEGQVALSTESKWSVTAWTTVTPSSFTLVGGETKEVTATIKVPNNAAGGRYGSFVFGVKSEVNGQTAAALSQQIASLFLLRISGPVNEKLTLEQFSAPKLSEFGPVPFGLRISNQGNVYTKTYGLINVVDMFGRKVEDIIVPGTNVFPQAVRNIHPSLNKGFLIGKYTATTVMYYGTVKNDTLSATINFYVFPVRIAIPIFTLLLIIFLIRKRLGKALKVLFSK